MDDTLKAHWETVYASKDDAKMSWHQEVPTPSLDLADVTGLGPSSSLIDIGGGASHLVDNLVERGLSDLTILDISQRALSTAQARLGARGSDLCWIVADITTWQPQRTYDFWHDRAVFHFLTDPADRTAYIKALSNALAPNGHAIIATFAPDGPEHCSGLSVVRYDPASLGKALGPGFDLVTARTHLHITPQGRQQSFQFSLFRRI